MNTSRNRSALFPVAILAAFVLVGAVGYWLGSRNDARHAADPAAGPATEKTALYWYDPMVPDKRFDKPGKSPFMDMQLVPKYADAGGGDAGIVRVAADTLQNLGMRTEKVERGTLSSGVRVPGSVAWDLRSAYVISARADGVIEKLIVRAPYEVVREGQALAELVAPEWSAAAQEYLALGRADSADARALQGAARNRLRVLGMDDQQIRNLRGGNPRVVLRAPADGVVSMLDVRQGQRVQAGMPLMTINGLDTVWVDAAIPQSQAIDIAPGTKVKADVSAFPGETFDGEVESLLPTIESGTRTQMARIVLQNPDRRLAPGMFADLQFAGGAGASQLLVPDDALIATGGEARVIVALGDGKFRPVRVSAGRSAGGKTEILRGLQGGEQVVVSGQFLIDSEASLSGALERMTTLEDEDTDTPPHDDMPGMEMPEAEPAIHMDDEDAASDKSEMDPMPGMDHGATSTPPQDRQP